VQSLFKKNSNIINGSIFGKFSKKNIGRNRSKKFYMGDASKKSINHQFVSNGETSENENSELSQNFRTVNLKNKKLLKFRKDKNDINAQIRQYTSKNIPEFNKNIVRKDRIKSKTIKQTEINLTKSQKSSNKFFSLFKPEHFYV